MKSRFVTFFLRVNRVIVEVELYVYNKEEKKLENINVAKYLSTLLFDEELEYKKEIFFNECKGSQLVLLWKIFFETEIDDVELLKERVYAFGSNLREQDYLGREVFVCLVALLHLVIK